jgi:phosphatidylglycerophosphate synthase
MTTIKGIEISGETVCTVPNAMDVVATGLAVHGILAHGLDTPQGIAEVAVAEIEDLVNGPTARALGQTSDFGALMDSGLDKAKGALEIWELWRKGIVPRWMLAVSAAQDATNVGATVVERIRHPGSTQKAEEIGRRARFKRTTGFGVMTIGNAMKERYPRSARLVRAAGFVITSVGIVEGMDATRKYVSRAKQANHGSSRNA